MGKIKEVMFDCDEDVWAQAKAQAAREKIDLKDFVIRALKYELDRTAELSLGKAQASQLILAIFLFQGEGAYA